MTPIKNKNKITYWVIWEHILFPIPPITKKDGCGIHFLYVREGYNIFVPYDNYQKNKIKMNYSSEVIY